MENVKGPFLRDKNNTKKIMLNLVLALLPICIFAIYKNGIIPYIKGKDDILEVFRILIFLIVGPVTTYVTEYVYYKLFMKDKKDYFINSYSYIPGLFLSLLLPVNTPIIYLIIGSILSIIIGKMLFGGFGENIFNPALIGYLLIMTMYSSNFSYLNKYEIDTISSATPLTNLNLVDMVSYDTVVKPFGSLFDFFIGFIPGSIGEVSALLCLLGFIYLVIKKSIKWRIPVLYISTVFIITGIIGLNNNLGIWYPLFQILSGGLFFGAIFMATDPVTSPTTRNGQIIFGISLGILTVILRYLTSASEGVSIAILTMNMFVFIVEKLSVKFKNKYIYLMPLVVVMLLLAFSIKVNTNKVETDPNYEILSKEVRGGTAKYIVTEKGNNGKIKASIEIKDNKIIKMEILEHSETSMYFEKVLNANYIDKIIYSDNLSNMDTVSGATISSTALKKMAINTLNDYKKGDNTSIKKEEDTTFKVLNKEVIDDSNIYTVSDNSFGGVMTLKLILKDNKVTNIEFVSYNDTCVSMDITNEHYKCPNFILSTDYLNNLLNNQDNLDNVDTISGATISSKAIKKIISETIKVDGENNE